MLKMCNQFSVLDIVDMNNNVINIVALFDSMEMAAKMRLRLSVL